MCVMFIIRNLYRTTESPLVFLSRNSIRKEASGRRRGNGGALRKLVIIGLSFFSIPKPKWYGTDDALEDAVVGKGSGTCAGAGESELGKFVKLYSITSTYLIHEP